jgi:putative ABC transport system permease protein
MGLDSANRNFTALVISSLLLGVYVLCGAVGCVLVPLIVSRVSDHGVSGLVEGGHNLLPAVALALAKEHHLQIGDTVTLASPDPITVRVAALSTNIGWAPGAIIMSAGDYARAWGSPDSSAYNVLVTPGSSPGVVAGEIRRVLGRASGLSAQTAQAHADEQNALSRQGLDRLSQIAELILVVAVLAMAAAIASMVWQRRPRLAKLKLEGFARAELWRTILLESLLLLGVGCLSGAVFGLYGQQLLDRALANVVNFPVVHSVAALAALISLAIVTAAAAVIVAVPGYLAAGLSDVRPSLLPGLSHCAQGAVADGCLSRASREL